MRSTTLSSSLPSVPRSLPRSAPRPAGLARWQLSIPTEKPLTRLQVAEALKKRANDFNVVMEDVAITHLSFGSEFSRAIEAKQVAEQEAERAKYMVQKADQERRAAVIRAEGESEAARLISDATRQAGPGLVELRRIEAAKDIASQLSKAKNVTYLPPNQGTLVNLGNAQ